MEFNKKWLDPLISLKEQLKKDKKDKNLRQWKTHLLEVVNDVLDNFVMHILDVDL